VTESAFLFPPPFLVSAVRCGGDCALRTLLFGCGPLFPQLFSLSIVLSNFSFFISSLCFPCLRNGAEAERAKLQKVEQFGDEI
jgi:hypothetical protein